MKKFNLREIGYKEILVKNYPIGDCNSPFRILPELPEVEDTFVYYEHIRVGEEREIVSKVKNVKWLNDVYANTKYEFFIVELENGEMFSVAVLVEV